MTISGTQSGHEMADSRRQDRLLHLAMALIIASKSFSNYFRWVAAGLFEFGDLGDVSLRV